MNLHETTAAERARRTSITEHAQAVHASPIDEYDPACALCAEAERRGLLPDPTEPTTCTCETPNPDGLGECRTCRRLVVEGES